MASKRILMLVGDYVEDYEAMVPFQMLLMVGHHVDAVCPDKRPVRRYARPSTISWATRPTARNRGTISRCTADFDAVNPADYDALVIPGGRAPEYLRLDDRVLHIVRHFGAAGKPIASVCHGPQILLAAGLIEGKCCTAYPAVKPDLIRAGGRWIDANVTFTQCGGGRQSGDGGCLARPPGMDPQVFASAGDTNRPLTAIPSLWVMLYHNYLS